MTKPAAATAGSVVNTCASVEFEQTSGAHLT